MNLSLLTFSRLISASAGKHNICRHCGELFVFGRSSRCPDIVGPHEPNIVFKDNDLTSKMRLQAEDSFAVLDTLNKDSDALCKMGIMDYSLLIGVTNQQFEIDDYNTMRQQCQSRDRKSFSIDENSAALGDDRFPCLTVSRRPSFREASGSTSMSSGRGATAAFHGAFSTGTGRPDRGSPITIGATIKSGSSRSEDREFVREYLRVKEAPQLNRSFSEHNIGIASLQNDTASGSCNGTSDRTSSTWPSKLLSHSNPQTSSKPESGSGINVAQHDGSYTEIFPGFKARAVVAPSRYYLGVVDILQAWTTGKRIESTFKTRMLCQDANGISCIPPAAYAKRFQRKAAQIIEHSIFVREVTGSWNNERVIAEPTLLKGSSDHFMPLG
jgi:hypothetical protein